MPSGKTILSRRVSFLRSLYQGHVGLFFCPCLYAKTSHLLINAFKFENVNWCSSLMSSLIWRGSIQRSMTPFIPSFFLVLLILTRRLRGEVCYTCLSLTGVELIPLDLTPFKTLSFMLFFVVCCIYIYMFLGLRVGKCLVVFSTVILSNHYISLANSSRVFF